MQWLTKIGALVFTGLAIWLIFISGGIIQKDHSHYYLPPQTTVSEYKQAFERNLARYPAWYDNEVVIYNFLRGAIRDAIIRRLAGADELVEAASKYADPQRSDLLFEIGKSYLLLWIASERSNDYYMLSAEQYIQRGLAIRPLDDRGIQSAFCLYTLKNDEKKIAEFEPLRANLDPTRIPLGADKVCELVN